MRPTGSRSEVPDTTDQRPATVLEPGAVEYGLHHAQYEAVVRELREAGFPTRLVHRRTAYRNVGTRTFGTFFDLVVRLGTNAAASLDVEELIARIQHLLSTEVLPPEPRMGKLMFDDGTEHPFPLDTADVP